MACDGGAENDRYEPISIDVGNDNEIVFSSRSGQVFALKDSSTVPLGSRSLESFSLSDPTYIDSTNRLLVSGFDSSKRKGGIFEIDRLSKSEKNVFLQSDCQCRFPAHLSNDEIIFALARRRRGYLFGGELWTDWCIMSVNTKSMASRELSLKHFHEINSISVNRVERIIYFCGRESEASVSELFQLCVDSGESSKIFAATQNNKLDSTSAHSVFFVPSQKAILFVSDRERPFWYDLFSLPISAGARLQRQDLLSNKFIECPRVSSDGSSLFFLSEDGFDVRNRPMLGIWMHTYTDGSTVKLHGSDLFITPEKYVKP
jgi:hypothetical protein